MSMLGSYSLNEILFFALCISAIGVFIEALEDLYLRTIVQDQGLVSWKVHKLQFSWTAAGRTSRIVDKILRYPNVLFLGGIRASAALAVFFSYGNIYFQTVCTLTIFLSLVLMTIRSPYGLDGAHQMRLIVFGTISLYGFVSSDPVAMQICVWFITIQVCLSYLIAGLAKLFSVYWRNGRGLTGIFSTSTYGHPFLYKLLQSNSWIPIIASWTVIIFEVFFVFVLVISPQYGILILIIGIFFHLSNAVFMGLNGFFFSFVGTYPIVMYCASQVHELVTQSLLP